MKLHLASHRREVAELNKKLARTQEWLAAAKLEENRAKSEMDAAVADARARTFREAAQLARDYLTVGRPGDLPAGLCIQAAEIERMIQS